MGAILSVLIVVAIAVGVCRHKQTCCFKAKLPKTTSVYNPVLPAYPYGGNALPPPPPPLPSEKV